MRTNEELFDHVIKRVGELETQKRKRRAIVLKAAAPVCGIAVIAGAAAALRNGRADTKPQVTSDVDVVSGEVVPDWIDDRGSENSVVESAPQYVANTLNIGEVEISEGGELNLFAIPGLYEMTRDEVLEHFGLSSALDLSDVVDGLYETFPRNSILNPERKHGFMRFYSEDENGVGTWEEIGGRFDNEEFVFESADGSKTAVVIFDHNDRVFWLRSGILSSVEDEDFQYFSTEPFYGLPTSTVAGVEMLIAHRNIGGYYAEFRTNTLSVGLITEGLSEDETVAILEYLAEYTGAADDTPETNVSVSDIDVSYPDLIN